MEPDFAQGSILCLEKEATGLWSLWNVRSVRKEITPPKKTEGMTLTG
jgi:hypothetical protein